MTWIAKTLSYLFSFVLILAVGITSAKSQTIDANKQLIEDYKPVCKLQCLSDSNIVKILLKVGTEYSTFNSDSAQAYFTKAINLALKIKWFYGIGTINEKIGDWYILNKNYDKALQSYDDAMEAWQGKLKPLYPKQKKGKIEKEEIPVAPSFFISEKAITFSKMAAVYAIRKEYETQEFYLKECIEKALLVNNQSLVCFSKRQLGLLEENRGNYPMARYYLYQLLKTDCNKNNFEQLAADMSKIGDLYCITGDSNDCKNKHQEAQDILLKSKKASSEKVAKNKKGSKKVETIIKALADERKNTIDILFPRKSKTSAIIDASDRASEDDQKQILNPDVVSFDEVKNSMGKLTIALDSLKKIKTFTDNKINAASRKGDYIKYFQYQSESNYYDSLIDVLNEYSWKVKMKDIDLSQERLLNENQKRLAKQEKTKSTKTILSLYENIEKNKALIVYITSLLITITVSGFLIFVFYKRKRDSEQRQKSIMLSLQIADTEMKAFRAQMNPHFIFNALVTINEFVRNHKPDEASVYLEKFSHLMRFVVDNSQNKEVALQKDLKALQDYIEVERLNKYFDYEIYVSHEVDTGFTKIPPLILQPFVENAIKHGLRPLTSRGLLKINITLRSEDVLQCIVEDNGMGRSYSNSSPSFDKRESMGMKITQERLNLYNRLNNVNASFIVTDLMDTNHQPKGTRITLLIPLV